MKKVIPNTDGIYFADKLGNIYKQDKKIGKHLDRKENGYFQCAVKINGKYQKQKVHRLVAMAFIGIGEKMVVNHKDGNKLNNNVDNLEVITQYENVKHSKKLDSFMQGKKKAGMTQRSLSVEQTEELLKLKDIMSLRELGRKFNIHPSTVSTYIKRFGLNKKIKCINQYI